MCDHSPLQRFADNVHLDIQSGQPQECYQHRAPHSHDHLACEGHDLVLARQPDDRLFRRVARGSLSALLCEDILGIIRDSRRTYYAAIVVLEPCEQ